MPSRPLLPTTLAFALGLALAACSDAPAPAADTPATAPADTPTPVSEPEPEIVPAPVEVTGPVPMRFHGEWNRVPGDCGTANNDSRLVIGPESLQFYESTGTVVQVAEEGSDVQLTVQRTGEDGAVSEQRHAYRLSPDGRSLSDLGGSGLVRQRCPS